MASQEPIQTDASTVHRDLDAEVAAEAAAEPSSTDKQDLLPLTEAQTVIRGSSRAGPGSKPLAKVDQSPAAVAKVLLGQRLNHFLLEELIGGGGMGAVFRARDEQLNRTVAIKVVPFVGVDPDLQRRFRNEAQSAAKLDHPRIARVFDVGSQDDWHYIVFEYIRGTNIRDLVTRGGVLPIDDAVFYTCQLAEAIQHAADRGIVHRDIKPSNVLIGEEDKIKLVDMGLARSDNFELSEDMTASGVTLGTFDYISPEQARDPRDADLRSDIYSLGCTLYFMLTGSPPYPGGTMLQKLLSHGNDPPPDARELRPEVSDDLMAVIERMLAKNPEDRYQRATDLVADLREVACRDGLTRSQGVGVVAMLEPNRFAAWLESHIPWLVAATILVFSAGWLQLMSTAARDDFQLVIPDGLSVPASINPAESLDVDSLGNGADAADDPGSDWIGPNEVANRLGNNVSTFSDSPRLKNLPLPAELSDDVPDNPTAQPRPSADGSIGVSVSPEPAGIEYHVIQVVGTDVGLTTNTESDALQRTRSLKEALELASLREASDPVKIEIAVPLLFSEPVTINRDRLLITSSVGSSMVVFKSDDAVTMRRSEMMSIGSHRIEMKNLHFVWNVTSGEIDGGALFALNANRLVGLTNCTVTINNPTLRDEVYAFAVVTDPDKVDQPQEEASLDDDSLPLVSLELENVVVRGQITMIHMDFAADLRLLWENGLLAVSRRMIDTAGAQQKPQPTTGPIQLSLARVTAHVPLGLFRMRLGAPGDHPVQIDRKATDSVFVVNPGSPHVEISGLQDLANDPPLLELRGEANAYVGDPQLTDPMLLLSDVSGNEGITRMADLSSSPPEWAGEKSARWSVRWSAGRLPDLAPSQLKPSDYGQYGARSGFDEELLSLLPAVDRRGADSTPLDSTPAVSNIGEEL